MGNTMSVDQCRYRSKGVRRVGDITIKTTKILFGQNGNQCSFLGCKVAMIDASGTILGEMCHINARNARGARFDSKLPPKMRQSEENLILLCRNHHKSVDDNPSVYDADTLKDMKASHNTKATEPDPETFEWFARLLLSQSKIKTHVVNNSGNVAINSPGAVQAKTVNIKQGRGSVKIAPPIGSIGANAEMASYIEYLIKRYNRFASMGPGKSRPFGYGALSTNIAANFGSKWALVSQDRFEALVLYIQGRISRTKQAKTNASRGHDSFHSFIQHVEKLS
jgi:hypothetical protein